jgi:hypothetical protein
MEGRRCNSRVEQLPSKHEAQWDDSTPVPMQAFLGTHCLASGPLWPHPQTRFHEVKKCRGPLLGGEPDWGQRVQGKDIKIHPRRGAAVPQLSDSRDWGGCPCGCSASITL